MSGGTTGATDVRPGSPATPAARRRPVVSSTTAQRILAAGSDGSPPGATATARTYQTRLLGSGARARAAPASGSIRASVVGRTTAASRTVPSSRAAAVSAAGRRR